MPCHRRNDSRRHSVLPFKAKPTALSCLRRNVLVQLKMWGAVDAIEAAQLAVTELATNVIKHVGEGSPGTLEMEARETCLWLAMHDTSPVLPVEQRQSVCQESGRGLALLAALSDGWGVVHTPSGKAVWCELPTEASSQLADGSGLRVSRAEAVVGAYREQIRGESVLFSRSAPVAAEAVAGLITDLLYWLTAHGCDPDEVLDRAQVRFEAENA